jgi:hypothetical protein
VSCDSANDLIVNARCDGPKVFSGNEAVNVGIAERFVVLSKNLSHCGEESPRQISVTWLESL